MFWSLKPIIVSDITEESARDRSETHAQGRPFTTLNVQKLILSPSQGLAQVAQRLMVQTPDWQYS